MSLKVTVSQVNTYIRDIIDSQAILNNIYVSGEISNFKLYRQSGHIYFTLKDSSSQLKAVMFRANAERLRFMPEDGMSVVCRGKISVFHRDGLYQLYVDDIQPDGAGALAVAYEQLKEKLESEGLFDNKYKKPIPLLPNKIGVVTSNSGAAVEDIKSITKRRYPLCEIIIVPTIVQGDAAVDDIVSSIEMLDNMDDIDTIIVGRGGGSIEDLWAFNSESVARAIFKCSKPIISAVGHETDWTICDFVADLRAATPSAAAELAVPNIDDLYANLRSYKSTLYNFIVHKIDNENQRLDDIYNSSLFNYDNYFNSHLDDINAFQIELVKNFKHILELDKLKLGSLSDNINSLNPLAVLSRGYGLIKKDESVLTDISKVDVGDDLNIYLKGGSVKCRVNEVNYEDE